MTQREHKVHVSGVSASAIGSVVFVLFIWAAVHGPDGPRELTLSGAVFCALGGPAYCQTGKAHSK